MPADMAALIQRIEQAEASQQAPWIKRAVDEAWKAGWITDEAWHKAEEYLNAGALLDAAVSLVPSSRMWFLGHMDPSDMRFAATISEVCGIGGMTWRGFHATPALALCAAALKAMEARDAE